MHHHVCLVLRCLARWQGRWLIWKRIKKTESLQNKWACHCRWKWECHENSARKSQDQDQQWDTHWLELQEDLHPVIIDLAINYEKHVENVMLQVRRKLNDILLNSNRRLSEKYIYSIKSSVSHLTSCIITKSLYVGDLNVSSSWVFWLSGHMCLYEMHKPGMEWETNYL